MKRFLDTNVLVYAFAEEEDLLKGMIAREQVVRPDAVISHQVLLETTNVLRGKRRMEIAEIRRRLSVFLPDRIVRPSPEAVADTWRIMERYGFHTFDASLVATALGAGCEELITEDLSHLQVIEGLRVVNPFR